MDSSFGFSLHATGSRNFPSFTSIGRPCFQLLNPIRGTVSMYGLIGRSFLFLSNILWAKFFYGYYIANLKLIRMNWFSSDFNRNSSIVFFLFVPYRLSILNYRECHLVEVGLRFFLQVELSKILHPKGKRLCMENWRCL